MKKRFRVTYEPATDVGDCWGVEVASGVFCTTVPRWKRVEGFSDFRSAYNRLVVLVSVAIECGDHVLGPVVLEG